MSDEPEAVGSPVTEADAWAPIDTRWIKVEPGAIFLDKDEHPWMVEKIDKSAAEWRVSGGVKVTAKRGERTLVVTKDADEVIPVLNPLVERRALRTLAAGELGPRVMERPAA